jgi:hypothetical protein
VWTMANEGRIDPIEQHAFGPEAGGTPRKIAKTDSTASEEAQSQLLGTPLGGTGSGSRQAPLSATERVLNQATRSPSRGRSNPPSHAASPAGKAAPTPVQDDVTAQLRRLAEGDAAPRAVLVRPAFKCLNKADPSPPGVPYRRARRSRPRLAPRRPRRPWPTSASRRTRRRYRG